jgi:hypothetical protein
MDIFSQSALKLKNILDRRQSIIRDIRDGKCEHITSSNMHMFSIYEYEFCLTVIVATCSPIPNLPICVTNREIITVRTDMSVPDMWIEHYYKTSMDNAGTRSNPYLLNITNINFYKVPMNKCRRNILNSIDNFKEIYRLSGKSCTYPNLYKLRKRCKEISLTYFNIILGDDYTRLKKIHGIEVNLSTLVASLKLPITIDDIYNVRHNVLVVIDSCRTYGNIPVVLQSKIRIALRKTGDIVLPVIDEYIESLQDCTLSMSQLSLEAFYCDNLIDFLRPYNRRCRDRTDTVSDLVKHLLSSDVH